MFPSNVESYYPRRYPASTKGALSLGHRQRLKVHLTYERRSPSLRRLAALVEHKDSRNLGEIARLISRLAIPIELARFNLSVIIPLTLLPSPSGWLRWAIDVESGTFETCRRALRMSAYRVRPEGIFSGGEDRF